MWQVGAYIKQSHWVCWVKNPRGPTLIYDRWKRGDFSRAEEIPLLVFSLKIPTAVDSPPSPREQLGSLPSHQAVGPSSAQCPCTDLLSGHIAMSSLPTATLPLLPELFPLYRKLEFLAAGVCSLTIPFSSTNRFFSGGDWDFWKPLR